MLDLLAGRDGEQETHEACKRVQDLGGGSGWTEVWAMPVQATAVCVLMN